MLHIQRALMLFPVGCGEVPTFLLSSADCAYAWRDSRRTRHARLQDLRLIVVLPVADASGVGVSSVVIVLALSRRRARASCAWLLGRGAAVNDPCCVR